MRFETSEKAAATLLALLGALAAPWYVNSMVFVFLVFLRSVVPGLGPVSKRSGHRFRVVLRTFLAAALVMTILNALLIEGGSVLELFQGISLHADGALFGLTTGLRLLVIAASLLIFFGSTTVPHLAQSLQSAGLSRQIVMTLLLTLYFIDHLPDRIEQIYTAQEARGAPVRSNMFGRIKSFFFLLSPLVLSSLVESIERSMALELRGFESGQREKVALSVQNKTSPLAALFLIGSVLTLLWIIVKWLQTL